MKFKRSFLLYLLAILFLIAALVSISGVVGTVQSWGWLMAFSISINPVYWIFKGVFIALACLASAIALLQRYFWSVFFSLSTTIITAMWYWVDRVVLTKNPLPFSRHILPLIVTFFCLSAIALALYFVKPEIDYFQLHKQNKSTNSSASQLQGKNE